ncbi:MAG: hypothetical protein NWS56_05860 [Haliea sp.]|nr:hypothetical protein [Haliea sp.]
MSTNFTTPAEGREALAARGEGAIIATRGFYAMIFLNLGVIWQ